MPSLRRLITYALIALILATSLSMAVAFTTLPLVTYSYSPSYGVRVDFISPPLMSIGPTLPFIEVTDSSGRPLKAVVNIYGIEPGARLTYIGGSGGTGVLRLNPSEFGKLKDVMSEWRSRGLFKGYRDGFIFFIDAVDDKGRLYTAIKVIPINVDKVLQGLIPDVKITLNLQAMKPVKNVRLEKITKITTIKQSSKAGAGSASSGILTNCVNIYGEESVGLTYCTTWKVENLYRHGGSAFIPLITVRSDSPTAWRVFEIMALYLVTNINSSMWIGITAVGTVSINNGVTYESPEVFGYSFQIDPKVAGFVTFNEEDFSNARWVFQPVKFSDDVIVSIGTYGSLGIGKFRKYEKWCGSGSCDITSWQPTNEVAYISFSNVNMSYDPSANKYVAPSAYMVDDEPGDGNGFLDRYLSEISDDLEYWKSFYGIGEVKVHNLWVRVSNDIYFSLGFDVKSILEALGVNVPSCVPNIGLLSFASKVIYINFIKIESYYTSDTLSLTFYEGKALYGFQGSTYRVPVIYAEVQDVPS